jgi:hypothetical protein
VGLAAFFLQVLWVFVPRNKIVFCMCSISVFFPRVVRVVTHSAEDFFPPAFFPRVVRVVTAGAAFSSFGTFIKCSPIFIVLKIFFFPVWPEELEPELLRYLESAALVEQPVAFSRNV